MCDENFIYLYVQCAKLISMKKQEAIKIFGTRSIDLAKALGRVKSAISQWPEDLTEDQINMVVGAAIRSGRAVPNKFLTPPRRNDVHGQ